MSVREQWTHSKDSVMLRNKLLASIGYLLPALLVLSLITLTDNQVTTLQTRAFMSRMFDGRPSDHADCL